ncbi:MAG: hypothetical protein A3K03_04945 [Bdellovibrionales bacterium RIFOXYD1_FULL_44_7]|nr:MAG: hypothetical protein A3K03_04945 [Bdellovibrionales bacterium RIFOXYD1_FULL_44_7]
MGHAKQINKKNINKEEQEIEVLYQKMGDRWFAFSLIDDEVFVGSISQEEIDAAEQTARANDLTTRV